MITTQLLCHSIWKLSSAFFIDTRGFSGDLLRGPRRSPPGGIAHLPTTPPRFQLLPTRCGPGAGAVADRLPARAFAGSPAPPDARGRFARSIPGGPTTPRTAFAPIRP